MLTQDKIMKANIEVQFEYVPLVKNQYCFKFGPRKNGSSDIDKI